MITEFKRIGIVTRPQTPRIEISLHELIDFLLAEKIDVFIDRESVEGGVVHPDDLPRCRLTDKDNIGRECGLVIVLGGDGTFLSAARKVAPYRIPLVGVNQGHLGFLTQVPREEMLKEIAGILTGKHQAEERILLETDLIRNGTHVKNSLALNDVVISRGGAGQMIEFETFINKEFVYTQRSDGLIVSTPTGSTAYALAAGGPIAVPDTCEIDILITKAGDARAHFDGQSYIDIQSGDMLRIRRYRHSLRILHPGTYRYYKTLRQKLHWGEQLVPISQHD